MSKYSAPALLLRDLKEINVDAASFSRNQKKSEDFKNNIKFSALNQASHYAY